MVDMPGRMGASDGSGDITTGVESPAPDATLEDTPPAPLGPLLDEPDDQKVIRAILKNWRDQNNGISYQLCEVEQAEYWRDGERWVFIRPASTDSSYELWRPPGIDRMPAMPDKVDQLVRRSTAQLLVDQPEGEAVPTRAEESAEQAAQLASKIFEIEGGEDGWNFRAMMEGAIDIAYTQKSAFADVWMDPTGGGEQYVTILAHPKAMQYDPDIPEACLSVPVQQIDPQTGQMVTALVESNTPVLKYLGPNNILTAKPTAESIKRWVPWPRVKLLGFRNVRFLPAWTRGARDADGLIVMDYRSIGELKQRYPETVGKMSTADLRKMIAWQPFPDYQILPYFVLKPSQYGTQTNTEVVPDDAVALVMWEHHRQSPVYPKGATVCIAGGTFVLDRGTLEVQVQQPDGTMLPEVLDPPVSQCRCITDYVGMNPYGIALVSKLGPWAELMGQQWAAVMDWLDRWNHPNQFLPIGSIVQPNQLAMRTGEPIYTNPQGEPYTEPVPAIPGDVKEFLDRSVEGMDQEALLSETAQGLETPNVNSGRQAAITINQALVALSSIQANGKDFFEHTLTLLLQRLRAFVSVPMAVEYEGEDGSFKADEWRGADLVGAKAIKLKKGTFTMLHPDAQKQMLMQDVQLGLLTLDEVQDRLADRTRSSLGLDADVVRQRVKRQIDACLTKNTPFDPLPADMLMDVARKRFRELVRTTMTARFQKASDPAKRMLMEESERMRKAAGILTIAEQQQMQQHAQQAQVQAKAQEQQAKVQGQIATDAAKSQNEVRKEAALAQLDMQKDVMERQLGMELVQ